MTPRVLQTCLLLTASLFACSSSSSSTSSIDSSASGSSSSGATTTLGSSTASATGVSAASSGASTAVSSTGSGVSPNCTFSPPAAEIVDSQGAVYTIVGGQIARNGVVDPSTAEVVLLGYDAGLIYQENAAGNWFSTTAAGWPTPVWTELGMAANPCTGTSTTGAGTATTAVGVATSSTTGHGASTSTGSSTSGSSGSGIAPPAQAAAAGFHTLVFSQGGDAGWNIDTNHTGDAGYAWYESGGFYGASDAVTSVSNGVLTLVSNSMTSATRRIVDNDAGYVGYAFGDGFYVQAELAIDAGCVAGGSGVFSAFWGLPIEKELVLSVTDDWPGQVKDYEHYVELDFMEYWGNYTSFYTLDWWGVYQTTCPGSSYCDCGNNGGCSGVPDNGPDDVPTGTNFSDFNVYGALVVPSQANDGGTGYTQGYFNNQPTPSHDVWSAYDPSLGPPPTGKQIFAATDVGHYYLIANTVPGCAMQMRYVRVWQAP